MKIIYDGDSLDRNPPSSFQEDANNVYCAGVVGLIVTVVPVATLAIGSVAIPALVAGMAAREGINAFKNRNHG